MRKDVRDRLRRLGVQKGARTLKVPPLRSETPLTSPTDQTTPAAPPTVPTEPQSIEQLLPGSRIETNDWGGCLIFDRVYPLQHQHGQRLLHGLLDRKATALSPYATDPRLPQIDFRRALFLDTETTGLWGVGTIAFMVGVGFYQNDAFVVRQFFCRDHGDEAAMLTMLNELIEQHQLLITFNGQTFDVPLLDNRYLMNRQPALWVEMPHLDLLRPARRVWRRRFGSVALSALERQLLGVRRSQADVPGALIPRMYHDYLREQDGRELVRVFYHNEFDILSMATLADELIETLDPATPTADEDLLSIARWQQQLGLVDAAETSLRTALDHNPELALYRELLLNLGQLYKRGQRLEEAVPLWQQAAVTAFDDVDAHVELAKYFEWKTHQFDRALKWTQAAIALAEVAPRGSATWLEQDALHHRRRRLERKLMR